MTEFGQQNDPSSLPRDEWLRGPGAAIYNLSGAQVAHILEQGTYPLPELEVPEGNLEQVSRALEQVANAMSDYADNVIELIQPQNQFSEPVVIKAKEYLGPAALGESAANPIDLMTGEGIATNFVMPARLTQMVYLVSGVTEGITPEKIADTIDSPEMRQMLAISSQAGLAFWRYFATKASDLAVDEDFETMGIDQVRDLFIERFNENNSDVEIDDVNKILTVNPETGRIGFSQLALDTMKNYKAKWNAESATIPDGEKRRTGNCPVLLGSIALDEISDTRMILDSFTGQRGEEDGDGDQQDELFRVQGNTALFDPLIPRLNRYFAQTIRSLGTYR